MGHRNNKSKLKNKKTKKVAFIEHPTITHEMYSTNIDWEKQETFDILKDQLNHCNEEITSYNSQFLSSSTLCAILTAVAGIISTTPDDNATWNLFYVLPTIYLLSLYNLIKYTMKQIQLGVYCWTLEYQINKILHKEVLKWTQKIPHGFDHWFLGAVAQLVFHVPISILMFWGFYQLNHGLLWWILGLGIILQIIVILLIAIRLCSTKNRTVKKFGYRIDKDGKLVKLF